MAAALFECSKPTKSNLFQSKQNKLTQNIRNFGERVLLGLLSSSSVNTLWSPIDTDDEYNVERI